MYEFITKLSISKGLNIALILFGCLISPFWFLYQFYSAIYKSTELTKFITLSFSIGVPLCLSLTLFNSLMLGKLNEANEEIKTEYKFLLMGVSSAFCGFTFYIPCIVKYVIPNISEKHAIIMIIYIYIGAISYSLFQLIKKGIIKQFTKSKKEKTKK